VCGIWKKNKLRNWLAADAAEFRSEVFRLLDARDLVARRAAVVRDQALAVSDLLGRGGREMHVGQKIGIGFGLKKSGQRGDLPIVEAVVRHSRARIVGAGILQPRLQPLVLDLGSNLGQLRPNVTAHHVSGGVLHGVA